jgi:hypothetical protein
MSATRRELRLRRARRRRGPVLVATLVVVVAALGCVVAALLIRRDTEAVQASAEPVQRELRELTAAEHDAEHRARALRVRSEAASRYLSALFAALSAQVDTSNQVVDVANQAVDQYNSAQTTDIAGAFHSAGDAAVADLEQRTAAVRTAAAAAQRAVAALQEAAGG